LTISEDFTSAGLVCRDEQTGEKVVILTNSRRREGYVENFDFSF
jgi:hypothetical protein